MANIIASDRVRMKLGVGIKAANAELTTIVDKYLKDLLAKMSHNVKDLEKKFAEAQGKFKKLEDRKKRIEQTIEKTLGSIQKMLKSELRIFFRDFAADSITTYTDACSIKISFFDRQSSTEVAIKTLTSALFDGLQQELKDFTESKQDDIQSKLDEMAETINEQLNDFDEILASIRSHMNMGDNSLEVRDISVTGQEMSDMMSEAFAGALVGGAAGAGAAWVAGQFFAIMAGPVGWGLAIAAAIGSALVALVSSTSAEDKVKQEFVKEAARKIRQDSDAWATKLSEQMSEGINQKKVNMIEDLNRKIAETKNPIIEAIELLKKDQSTLEVKKKELENFQQRYNTIYKECKELCEKLGIRD